MPIRPRYRGTRPAAPRSRLAGTAPPAIAWSMTRLRIIRQGTPTCVSCSGPCRERRGGYDCRVTARLRGAPTLKGTEMKYLLLIYGNQEKWASIPAEEWPEAIAKQDAFNRKYQATGELIGAYGLADAAAAKLVRRQDGLPAVTDGPYLETKEYIASFYLLDCESEERALQIAADMPWADQEPVEFWPILHEAKPDL